LSPDSAVQLKKLEARCDPGVAKTSDSAVSKSFWALASRCDQAQHPLAAPPIDVRSQAQTHRLAAEGLRLALPVDHNCGIRVECCWTKALEKKLEDQTEQKRFDSSAQIHSGGIGM
jgi:hypothetical protein